MEKLKELLTKIIEDEESKSNVEVHGTSLEEALKKASQELGVDISELDYEIKEFGGKGVFGLGKKDYVVNVYKSSSSSEVFQGIMNDDFSFDKPEEPVIIDKDSEAFVRVTGKGVLLKVTPTVGKGHKITEPKVLSVIASRNIKEFDKEAVKRIMRDAAGEYFKIGEMPINVLNDAHASVQISPDFMKAYLVMTAPKIGGYDLELDDIYTILKNNGVVVGLKDETLNKLIDYPVYGDPILVAEGIKPINGNDAELEYEFNTSDDIQFTEAEGGNIDFKNLNNLQNVVVGQLLATKKPATRGEPGRTVRGEMIPQRMGKDVEFTPGNNTHIDGDKIYADVNGQVRLLAGRVCVEEVYTVNGDVNLKSGNIDFLGSVIVAGNVEDGFSVKAKGNIEVHGTVGKATLQADGDIIITQGVMGKNEGFIQAGKSVTAKFLENVKIDAGDKVTVRDSVVHCFIDVTHSLEVAGKRAAIVGGRIRAGDLIKSKQIGTVSQTETLLEVGFDPKKRQELQDLEAKREQYYREEANINPTLSNLEYVKKTAKHLPPEKEELYQSLIEQSMMLKMNQEKTQKQIDEINEYFLSLQTEGRVIATNVAYPGVQIYIRNGQLKTKTEYKKSVFLLKGSDIDVEAYIEEESELRKAKRAARKR